MLNGESVRVYGCEYEDEMYWGISRKKIFPPRS